jgi:hypothetical protein
VLAEEPENSCAEALRLQPLLPTPVLRKGCVAWKYSLTHYILVTSAFTFKKLDVLPTHFICLATLYRPVVKKVKLSL